MTTVKFSIAYSMRTAKCQTTYYPEVRTTPSISLVSLRPEPLHLRLSKTPSTSIISPNQTWSKSQLERVDRQKQHHSWAVASRQISGWIFLSTDMVKLALLYSDNGCLPSYRLLCRQPSILLSIPSYYPPQNRTPRMLLPEHFLHSLLLVPLTCTNPGTSSPLRSQAHSGIIALITLYLFIFLRLNTTHYLRLLHHHRPSHGRNNQRRTGRTGPTKTIPHPVVDNMVRPNPRGWSNHQQLWSPLFLQVHIGPESVR